ncbi:SpoIID/LytB domain-containing protein [Syntrophomonas erecta subsp. sporosyntropha]
MLPLPKKWLAGILVTALLFTLAGCQKQAKKPEAPRLAPEVAKYKQEPTISLYRSETGKTEEIKLEEYLKGVVAAEIGPKFPLEALKAQAIVARTTTLALLEYENGTRDKHNTDASDNHTEFQAYDPKMITPDISRAVEETRGQVLTYQGKFVHALFHAASDGKTATMAEGFPKLARKTPYIVSVKTEGIKYAPAKYRNWTVKVPRWKVKNIMGSQAGNLDDIKISERGPSGRATTISAGKASIKAVDLRQEIGFDRLYSTNLNSVKLQGNDIVFKGSGWGHGVGMEQWGAWAMAKKGHQARTIVQHYFPRVQFTQLYS